MRRVLTKVANLASYSSPSLFTYPSSLSFSLFTLPIHSLLPPHSLYPSFFTPLCSLFTHPYSLSPPPTHFVSSLFMLLHLFGPSLFIPSCSLCSPTFYPLHLLYSRLGIKQEIILLAKNYLSRIIPKSIVDYHCKILHNYDIFDLLFPVIHNKISLLNASSWT